MKQKLEKGIIFHGKVVFILKKYRCMFARYGMNLKQQQNICGIGIRTSFIKVYGKKNNVSFKILLQHNVNNNPVV